MLLGRHEVDFPSSYDFSLFQMDQVYYFMRDDIGDLFMAIILFSAPLPQQNVKRKAEK